MEVTVELFTDDPPGGSVVSSGPPGSSPSVGWEASGKRSHPVDPEPHVHASPLESSSGFSNVLPAPNDERIRGVGSDECASGRGGTSANRQGVRALLATSRFLMAARDVKMERSMAVPALAPTTEAELQFFEEGQARQHERNRRRQQQQQAVGIECVADVGGGRVPQQEMDFDKKSVPPIDWSLICSSCAAAAAAADSFYSEGSVPPYVPPNASSSLPSGDYGDAGETSWGSSLISSRVRHVCVSRHADRNTTGTLFGGQALRLGYEVRFRGFLAHRPLNTSARMFGIWYHCMGDTSSVPVMHTKSAFQGAMWELVDVSNTSACAYHAIDYESVSLMGGQDVLLYAGPCSPGCTGGGGAARGRGALRSAGIGGRRVS